MLNHVCKYIRTLTLLKEFYRVWTQNTLRDYKRQDIIRIEIFYEGHMVNTLTLSVEFFIMELCIEVFMCTQ